VNPFDIGRMGGLEIIIVLLLAFLAIGPRRVIRAGKSLGRLKRRVQKATSRVTKAVSGIGEDEEVEEAMAGTKKVGSELTQDLLGTEEKRSEKEEAPA